MGLVGMSSQPSSFSRVENPGTGVNIPAGACGGLRGDTEAYTQLIHMIIGSL